MGHMDTQLLWGLVAAAAAAMLLVAEHYFPFPRLLGGGQLPPAAAYVLGCLALLLPFTVWGLALAYVIPVLVIWLVTIAGGGTVLLCYGLDSALNNRDRQAQNQRLEDALHGGPVDREA